LIDAEGVPGDVVLLGQLYPGGEGLTRGGCHAEGEQEREQGETGWQRAPLELAGMDRA
jgi:hypothetical protein